MFNLFIFEIQIEYKMTPKFKVGDVVILKSGGPEMTIHQAINRLAIKSGGGSENVFEGNYICKWFVNDIDLKESSFNQDSLELAE
jgi:uncharacterized protein YodC (DUF2158 family)